MPTEDEESNLPNPSSPEPKRPAGGLWPLLHENRSWLWRTSPLRPVRLAGFLAFLVLLGVVWRVVRYALGFPIWGDEAFVAINLIQRDYRGLIEPLVYGQIVPLLFMWGELAITQVLGLSEWGLRLLPFVAGVAALLLFWRFARRVLRPRAAFLAIGMFAAAYYSVRHAAELKAYSLDLLLSLSVMMLGWSIYQHPRSLGRWAALLVVATVGVWASYPLVFTIAGVGLVLAWGGLKARWSAPSWCAWAAFGVISASSFVAMFSLYAQPHAQAAAELVSEWSRAFPPLTQPWMWPVWFVYMHTGHMFAYPLGGAPPASLVTFVLFCIGVVSLWRSGRRTLVLFLLSPFVLAILAAFAQKYPYGGSARTMQYVAPMICLLAGQGIFAVLRRFFAGPKLAVSIRLVGVLFAVIIVGSLARDIARPYKSKRILASHNAVVQVAKQTRPNDRWVIFNATDEVPYAPFIGEMKGTGSQFAFDALRFGPPQIEWAPPPAEVEAKSGERIWLLAYRDSNLEWPEEQWTAYRTALETQLGPATSEDDIFIYDRKIDKDTKRRESLTVVQFGQ